MLVWPDNRRPEQEWDWSFERGDTSEVSHWTLGAHTGTHIDAPRHQLPGADDLESVDLDRLIGPARVVDLTAIDGHIERDTVEGLDLDGVRRVLLKTTNSTQRLASSGFDPSFVAVEPSGAAALLELDILAVGVDYLSVERYMGDDVHRSVEYPTHRALLGAGVAILEGLDLSRVDPGDYFLCFLPLRLQNSEASPARAVLIEADSLDRIA